MCHLFCVFVTQLQQKLFTLGCASPQLFTFPLGPFMQRCNSQSGYSNKVSMQLSQNQMQSSVPVEILGLSLSVLPSNTLSTSRLMHYTQANTLSTSWWRIYSLSAWVARAHGTKSRGSKGLQLQVGSWRGLQTSIDHRSKTLSLMRVFCSSHH